MRTCKVLFLSALLLGTQAAFAAALPQLRNFVESTHSGRASFTQTVQAKSGRKPQEAAGEMAFERPGKFRWTYEKPYYQLLVGDGTRLWIYDRDLNQVSVKKLGDALGSTPAALLAGKNELDKNFDLKEAGTEQGLEWVEAQPKSNESSFNWMRLGFADNQLRVMELRDQFGQTTRLEFRNFERNVKADAGQFKFTPPPGADVVGDK
ncbi:MAG: outer membrane lipoprotein chaperone LolA [Rhodocyclaceae bacterium]|nr:outer membrane lipoprotein chaperone LolA [Rhodocyclaceae bacterium]MBX3670276.1 outer membrane lipoprotein chaperone LolA [Rhodocyclaceae bacterium]